MRFRIEIMQQGKGDKDESYNITIINIRKYAKGLNINAVK